ncbi:MAG: RluA family pseudouridine synthase [Prevotella sp.]|nr:RluA family pseudouridine synthase [Prevotella sp.]
MDGQNENIKVEESVNENIVDENVDVNENIDVDENVEAAVDRVPDTDNDVADGACSEGTAVATKIIPAENSENSENSGNAADADIESEPLDGELAELYEHFRLVAEVAGEPVRVDKYLTEHLQHSSRSRIQRAAAAGYVFVNGKTVRNNHCVKQGDIITLMLSRPHYDKSIVLEDIPIDIVYEDADIVVVNKAAGMVVHPGIGNYTGTLVNALAFHMSNQPGFDPDDPSVGIVHRIDKDTSGLLVVAKNEEARENLAMQFFNKTTLRSYNALVWGHFDSDEGRIEGNISRDPKDRMRMTVTEPDSGIGKPAVTHWRTLERFGYVTLVECVLETGRTHQIRAHMSHIGHPLFADERYGGMEILRGENSASYKAFINNCFKICPRQALHARTLGFVHPSTGEEMNFSSDMPDDFSQLLDKWRTYIEGKK